MRLKLDEQGERTLAREIKHLREENARLGTELFALRNKVAESESPEVEPGMCPKDLATAHEFIKHYHADNVHLRARMEQKWQEALDLEQSNRELQNRLTKITQERDQARRDMQSWYQETLRLRAFSGRGGPSNGQG